MIFVNKYDQGGIVVIYLRLICCSSNCTQSQHNEFYLKQEGQDGPKSLT